MEAEINSPMIELQSGEGYAMDTSWCPTRADSLLRGVTSAGVILSPLMIAIPNNSIVLSGLFRVFFPGKLQARLFDSNGVEQQRIDLQSVAPQTCVELHREVQPSKRPARISIQLIDDQGIDRGSLGEAAVTVQ
jgi:hypothetical protein